MRLLRRLSCFRLTGLCLVVLAGGPAGAGQPEYSAARGGQVVILDEPCPPGDFPPIEIAFLSPSFNLPGGSESVQCLATARRNGNVVRQGVEVRLEGEILDLDGNTLRSLARRSRALAPYGRFSWPFTGDPDGDPVGVGLIGTVTGSALLDQLQVDCRAQSRVPCRNDQDTACLFGNGRFRVEVEWDDGSGGGLGRVRRVQGNTAEFWFFSPDNSDLLLKVLNECTFNDHFWVFYAATTNVEFDLRVVDTQSGATKSYFNPLGHAAPAVTDTAAFATCP